MTEKSFAAIASTLLLLIGLALWQFCSLVWGLPKVPTAAVDRASLQDQGNGLAQRAALQPRQP